MFMESDLLTLKDIEKRLKKENVFFRKINKLEEENRIYYLDEDNITMIALREYRGNAAKEILAGYLVY